MLIDFDFAAQRIRIEGDEPELVELLKAIRDIAPKMPNISISTNISAASTAHAVLPPPQPTGGLNPPASQNGVTMRQFVRSLRLDSMAERIAAIAYFKAQYEGEQTFSPRQMGDWMTQCGLQQPAQISVAVSDTKRRHGYVDSAGHGHWRITTNGVNLVVGRQEESGEAPQKE